MSTKIETVDDLLNVGLKDSWYAICPSSFIKTEPVSLRRLGLKLVLWRDTEGKLYALEDHCPHRGAPLSRGILMGDRIACGYHGVQVRFDGVVTSVPGSPGCSLEGKRSTRSFPVREAHGAVFLYNASENVDDVPDFQMPEELASPEWANFLCYTEWNCDYRYAIDNVMDPMHGTYLHKQSHSMFEGATEAEFGIREVPNGFVFEKKGQRGVNFDWSEWTNTGIHWLRLSIPYPASGGPGGSFFIVGTVVPIEENRTGVFFWRCRQVSGWHRHAWQFLYRNRLEQRHWDVLEQDRVMMEDMEPNANERESLYQHDIGLVRLRRNLRNLANEQFEALKATGKL